MLQQQAAAAHEVANHTEWSSSAVEGRPAIRITALGEDFRDLRVAANELHFLLEHLEGALR